MLGIIHKIRTRCKVWHYSLTVAVSEWLGLGGEELVREGARAAIVVAVGVMSFGLGMLAHNTSKPHTLELDTTKRVPYLVASSPPGSLGQAKGAQLNASKGTIVASRNGKKYYYLWCPGAERISAKNRKYFRVATDAEKAGYTIAKSCAQ